MQPSTVEQPAFGQPALSEPHFDEEATVLSARPVVPLAAVPAAHSSVGSPRPWILGLGLVAALLVGMVATAFYYSRQDNSAPAAVDDAQVTAGAEGGPIKTDDSFSGPAAVQSVVQPEKSQPVKTETVKVESPATSSSVKTPVETTTKPKARLVAVIKEKGNGTVITTTGRREERKADRREARQEQRRADRERRVRRSSDDVLRIQEIFEGTPRP